MTSDGSQVGTGIACHTVEAWAYSLSVFCPLYHRWPLQAVGRLPDRTRTHMYTVLEALSQFAVTYVPFPASPNHWYRFRRFCPQEVFVMRRVKALLCSCFAITVLLAQPALSQEVSTDSTATWELKVDDPIFPAVLLSTSSIQGVKSKTIGDPRGIVAAVIKPTVANARVHVEVRVDGLSEVSTLDATLGEANEKYTVAPSVRFDTHRLSTLMQPLPTTVVMSVKVNGVDLGQQTKSVQVRAVNDVPFLVPDKDGHLQDVSPLFAAFVNENSPIIDSILDEALHQNKAVQNFVGYQTHNPNDVQMQVFAVWNVLQRHQVKYSSITTASGYTEKVYSQSVRFVDDTWRVGQANCVDGTVLFASVLYKIGIYPMLVKLPGHMFLGYYVDDRGYGTAQGLQFLETTMVGAGHQPTVTKNVAFNPLWHPVLSSDSYRQFVSAVNYANQEFNQQVLPGLDKHAPGFLLIDVRRAREKGITPISH